MTQEKETTEMSQIITHHAPSELHVDVGDGSVGIYSIEVCVCVWSCETKSLIPVKQD